MPKNSLEAVEHFFGGEKVGPKLIEKVRSMPDDQVDELESHIAEAWLRQYRYLDSDGRGRIHLHEATFFNVGADADIAEIGALKYLLIYCKKIAITDPLRRLMVDSVMQEALGDPQKRMAEIFRKYASPAFPDTSMETYPIEKTTKAAYYAECLRQLLPLASLIRKGIIVPVEWPPSIYSPNILRQYNIKPQGADARAMTGSIFGNDPYLNWISQEYPDVIDEGRQKSLASMVLDDRGIGYNWEPLFKAYTSKYGADISPQELWNIRKFVHSLLTCELSSITSDPKIEHHLARTARVLIDGQPGPEHSPAGLAIRYNVPSLARKGLDEIISLRENEEVFENLREALGSLAAKCAEEQPGSFDEYKSIVGALAEDMVRPSIEKLKSWQRRSNVLALGGKSVGLGMGAGANLITTAIAGQPIPMSPAGAIGNFAGDRLARSPTKKVGATKTALDIYETLTLIK